MPGSEIDPAPPLDSRAANYAVVERIRDLVKWLIVIFGAIGGVLVTGIQLSDLDKVHGDPKCHAIVAIAVGVIGAGLVIASAIGVLLPIDLRVSEVEENEALTSRIAEERNSLLIGAESFGDLVKEREDAIAVAHAAWVEYQYDRKDAGLKANYENAKELAERPAEAVQKLMSFLLASKVQRKMKLATAGMFLGAALVVAAMVAFSIFINERDGPPVPKRLSAVVVRLTKTGSEQVSDEIGSGCTSKRMRAIATGGTPGDIEMTSIPRATCRAAHFKLTPSFGTVIGEERLPPLRACRLPRPQMPCVAYPNSAALIVGKSGG